MSDTVVLNYNTFKPEDSADSDDISIEQMETDSNINNADWMINESLDDWHKKKIAEEVNSIAEGRLPENPTEDEQELIDSIANLRNLMGEGQELGQDAQWYMDQIDQGRDVEDIQAELGGLETPLFDPTFFIADIMTGGQTAVQRGALKLGVRQGSKMIAKEAGRELAFGVGADVSMMGAQALGLPPIFEAMSGIIGPMGASIMLTGARGAVKNHLKTWKKTNPNVHEEILKIVKDYKTNPRMKQILKDIEVDIKSKGADPYDIKIAATKTQFREKAFELNQLNIDSAARKLTPEELARQKTLTGEIDQLKSNYQILVKKIEPITIKKKTKVQLKNQGLTPPSEREVGEVLSNAGDGYELKINWNRLETGEDVQNVINKLSSTIKKDIKASRRGNMSDEQIKNLAMKNLADDTDTVQELLARQVGQVLNAEDITAARIVLKSSFDETTATAQRYLANKSDDNLEALTRQWAITQRMLLTVTGSSSETGRALQAHRIEVGLSKDKIGEMEAMMFIGNDKLSSIELATMLTGLGDNTTGMSKFMKNAPNAKDGNQMRTLWINALLSSPQTHVVNTIGNLSTLVLQIPERKLANMVGKILGNQNVAKGEASQLLFGMAQGMKEAWRLKGNLDALGELIPQQNRSKIEIAKSNLVDPIADENLTGWQKMFNTFSVNAQKALPTNLLQKSDDLMKIVAGRMELNALAIRTATAEGLEGQAFTKRIAEIQGNPLKNAPQSVQTGVGDFQKYVTYQSDQGNITKSIDQVRRAVPFGWVVVPFLNTPANIAKFAVERTPLGAIKARKLGKDVKVIEQAMSEATDSRTREVFKQILNSKGAERDLAIARVTMGSSAMVVGGTLAATGMITGSGPKDPEMNKIWRRMGNQPYSMKIGGKWVSYQRIEPLAILFGLSADFAEISGELSEMEGDDLAADIVGAISRNMTSKTWLKGMTDAIGAIEDPTSGKAQRFLQTLAGTGVPTGVAQMARSIDPVYREVDTIIDKYKSRIPGYSDELPPRRDLWGNPILRGIGVGGDVWDNTAAIAGNMMNPFYISDVKAEPIDQTLFDMGLPLSTPDKNVSISVKGKPVSVKLNPIEYDLLIRRMNSVKFPSGKNLKEELNELVQTEAFKNADYDIQEMEIKGRYQAAKKQAVAEIKQVPTVKSRLYTKLKQQFLDRAGRGSGGFISEDDEIADAVMDQAIKADRPDVVKKMFDENADVKGLFNELLQQGQ